MNDKVWANYYGSGYRVQSTHDADATGTDGDDTWYKWTDTAATGTFTPAAGESPACTTTASIAANTIHTSHTINFVTNMNVTSHASFGEARCCYISPLPYQLEQIKQNRNIITAKYSPRNRL